MTRNRELLLYVPESPPWESNSWALLSHSFVCILNFVPTYFTYMFFCCSFNEALSSCILLKTLSIRLLKGNNTCMKWLSEFSGWCAFSWFQCLPTGKALWLALSLSHCPLPYYRIPFIRYTKRGQADILSSMLSQYPVCRHRSSVVLPGWNGVFSL